MDVLFQHTSSVNVPYGSLLYRLREIERSCFVVAETEALAEKLRESLLSIQPDTLLFPAIDLMPLSQGVPSADILSERVRVLSLLRHSPKPYVVVLSHKSFIRLLPPVSAFDKALIPLIKGEIINLPELCQILESYGYTRSSLVREVGEYTLKNHLLDVYPPDSIAPLRLILDGNDDSKLTLLRLAFFDEETQLTTENCPHFLLAPLAEFIFPKDKEGFAWPSPLAHSNFLTYYNNSDTITSYCSGEFSVIFTESPDAEDNKVRAIFDRLGAEKLLISSYQDACTGAFSVIERSTRLDGLAGVKQEGGYAGGFSGFTVELEKLFEKYNDRLQVCFFAEYEESARRIAIMLRRFNPRLVKNFRDLPQDATGFFVITGNWEFGFSQISGDRCVLFTGESDVSGKRKLFRKRLKQAIFTPFEKDIQTGDAVVHLNHGIGIFQGIERIKVLDK
ncbi:MAG: CarD family transcriptional regulator, partial [Brevinema sp.]